MPISIFLVDDNEVFRDGVRAYLHAQDGLRVIGEAGSGAEALAQVAALNPDVILLDWQMPGMSGLNVLIELAARQVPAHAIILSMQSDEIYITSALRNGARGYVLKDHIVSHLREAVETVVKGGQYISFPIRP